MPTRRGTRVPTVLKTPADLSKAVAYLRAMTEWPGPGPGVIPTPCAILMAEMVARVVMTYEDTMLTPGPDGGVSVDTKHGDWYVHPNGNLSRFSLALGDAMIRQILDR